MNTRDIKFERLGDSALLIRNLDTGGAPGLLGAVAANLKAQPPITGIVDAIAAHDSVAVYYDPWAVAAKTGGAIFETLCRVVTERLNSATIAAPAPHEFTVPICYGGDFGPDLQFVAERCRLSPGEVVKLHSDAVYHVCALGFAPGFPYLRGLPPSLEVPRRVTPRAAVPPGAVAIGGSHAGIYPITTSGSLQLIGRTPWRLFDSAKTPPARFRVGDRLRFAPIDREEFNLFAAEADWP